MILCIVHPTRRLMNYKNIKTKIEKDTIEYLSVKILFYIFVIVINDKATLCYFFFLYFCDRHYNYIIKLRCVIFLFKPETLF